MLKTSVSGSLLDAASVRRSLRHAACTFGVAATTLVVACHGPAEEASVVSSNELTSASVASCRVVDPVKRECTYKTVGGLSLMVDVFRKEGTEVRPALLWIHGGALIFGHRGELPAAQRNLYLSSGYVVVSVDYRLAPETKLDQIHQDIQDAYAWLRQNASALGVAADRIGIVGHSAGGYLTLTAGARLSPRPRALVSFYGYGDVRWYLTPPSEGSESCPADPFTGFPGGAPIAHTDLETDPAASSYEPTSCSGGNAGDDDDDDNGEKGDDDDNGGNGDDEGQGEGQGQDRFAIYGCAREKGYWPQVVGGKDPRVDSAFFQQFEAIENLSRDYPATLLLHGVPDDDVPFAQSQAMERALTKLGVTAKLEQDPNWGHGFDENFCGPTVEPAFAKVIRFLDEQLKNGE